MNKLLIPIAVTAALGGRARADSDAKHEADQHVARATALHAEGAFAQALDELKTAYALDPQPELLFAMGQIHVRLGQCTQAITYYERFLATRPGRSQESLARQAIETCKTNPPPVEPSPAPSTPAPANEDPAALAPPAVEPPREVTPPPPALPVVSRPSERSPWYGNYVADGLVAGGVVAGVAGLFVYRSAGGKRDAAEKLMDYQAYAAQIDDARSQRNVAIVLGATGVALIAAGGAYFFLAERRDEPNVIVAPGPDGGVVSWSGRW